MANDLASRNEVMLLAHEMALPESDLAFLIGDPADELRNLRQSLTNAMFVRQEPRFQRLAALSRIIPAAVTAKIAEFALGPVVSGRVAGVLDPKDAVKLAKAMKPEFLASLAKSLDPNRVGPIVQALPHDLTIKVGKLLVAERAHLVLGRFVAVAPLPVVLGVIEGEPASEVLEVAMWCEDKTALQAVVDELSDEVLSEVVAVAARGDALDDALTLLDFMNPATCGRLVAFASALELPVRERLVDRVIDIGAWDVVVDAFANMSRAQVAPLANLSGVRVEGVLDEFIATAHRMNQPKAISTAILAWDAETLVAAKSSDQLKLVGIREWIMGTAQADAGNVEAILDSI